MAEFILEDFMQLLDVEEVFQKAQLKSWLWLKHKVPHYDYSFVDWVLNPLPCIRSLR